MECHKCYESKYLGRQFLYRLARKSLSEEDRSELTCVGFKNQAWERQGKNFPWEGRACTKVLRWDYIPGTQWRQGDSWKGKLMKWSIGKALFTQHIIGCVKVYWVQQEPSHRGMTCSNLSLWKKKYFGCSMGNRYWEYEVARTKVGRTVGREQ